MTLSNGGLTVTPSGAGSWQSIRSSVSKTSGKLYAEFKGVAPLSASTEIFGLASSSASIASYLGGSTYSVGLYNAGSQASAGFTLNYAIPPIPAANDVWALAVDFAAGSVWISQNGVWLNGSNPATGTLPDLHPFCFKATVGALFLGMSYFNVNTGVWTLQATAASQKYAPPAGFTAWDGGTAQTPAQAYLARTVGGNEGGNAANITTLNDGLVADGVWPKLDALYVLAQQNQNDANLNLIGTNYSLTPVLGAQQTAVTFTSYVGYSGFVAGANTAFNPTTAPSPKYTQTSASMGAWATATSTGGCEIGNGANVNMLCANFSGSEYYYLNNVPGSRAASGTGGLYSTELSSPTNAIAYFNGANVGNTSGTAAAPANVVFTVGAAGTSSYVSAQTLSAAFIGASLGAAGQLALYNRLKTYMDAVAPPSFLTPGTAQPGVTAWAPIAQPATQGSPWTSASAISIGANATVTQTNAYVGGEMIQCRGTNLPTYTVGAIQQPMQDVLFYVVSPTSSAYGLSVTSGGSKITTASTGTQSGVTCGAAGYYDTAVGVWDEVPYTLVAGTVNRCVSADHISGIRNVAFYADNGAAITVSTTSTGNSGVNVPEYCASVRDQDFVDGQHEMRAVVTPNVGIPRVLQSSATITTAGGTTVPHIAHGMRVGSSVTFDAASGLSPATLGHVCGGGMTSNSYTLTTSASNTIQGTTCTGSPSLAPGTYNVYDGLVNGQQLTPRAGHSLYFSTNFTGKIIVKSAYAALTGTDSSTCGAVGTPCQTSAQAVSNSLGLASATVINGIGTGSTCTVFSGFTNASLNKLVVGDAVAFSAGASLGSLKLWQVYYVAATNFVNHSAFSVLTSPGGACLNGAGGATGLTVINDLSFETVYLKTAGSYIEPYYVDGTQARLAKQLPVLSGWLTIQPWTGQTHVTDPSGAGFCDQRQHDQG